MATGFATTLRTARANEIVAAIDAGTGDGKLTIYDGTQPATGAAVTTQNILSEHTMTDPCGSVTSGVLTFSAISDDTSANNGGTASWARITDSDDTFVMDTDVTATGGGGGIELDATTITAGGKVSVTGGTITEGNA